MLGDKYHLLLNNVSRILMKKETVQEMPGAGAEDQAVGQALRIWMSRNVL